MVHVEHVKSIVQGNVPSEWVDRHAAPHQAVFEGIQIKPDDS